MVRVSGLAGFFSAAVGFKLLHGEFGASGSRLNRAALLSKKTTLLQLLVATQLWPRV